MCERGLVPNESEGTFDFQYHITDHLGNVRVTFSTTPENYEMVEDFESGEDNGFQDLHRYTNINANTTSGGDEVALLQAGETGAMIFLSVDKRDTIDLTVNANYERAPSNNNFLGTAYDALFSSFDAAYGSGIEHGVSSSSSVFDEALNGIDMSGKGNSSTAPRAFLNYIFFDQEMNYVRAGFLQITTAAQGIGVHETISLNDIIADRKGYLLAYLSNENTEEVAIHWDDFTVYHGKTNVVYATNYYPGGFTFNSYTRTASTAQYYKFNGKELLPETQLYDFGARFYDPALMRWMSPDPLSDELSSWSPYNYALGNPILFIDPDGAFPFTFHIRAFAPFQSFGFGFHGDDRGFTTSTAPGVTSRVAQSFTLETNDGSITGGTPFSGESSHPLLGTDTGIPSGNAQVLSSSFGNGVSQFSLTSEFAGGNPLTPEGATPDINVFSALSVTENREEGFLQISGALTGDNFPSTEAFVTDPSGQSLFLGVGFLTGGRNTGPFTELRNENEDREITDFNLRIGIDADGNFQIVIFNGVEFSIQEFNSIFEQSNPLENR